MIIVMSHLTRWEQGVCAGELPDAIDEGVQIRSKARNVFKQDVAVLA